MSVRRRCRLAGLAAFTLAGCTVSNVPTGSPSPTAATPSPSQSSAAHATPPPAVSASTQPRASLTPTPSSQASTVEGYRWTRVPNLSEWTTGGGIGSGASGPAGIILLGQDGSDRQPFVLRSMDGEAWARTDLPADAFGGGIPRHVIAGGPGYVAVGYEGSVAQPDGYSSVIWLSEDGVNWIPDPSSTGWLRGEHASLVRGPGDLLAVRRAGADDAISLSTNGSEWTEVISLPLNIRAIDGGEFGLVATTVDSSWFSSDGHSWRPFSLPGADSFPEVTVGADGMLVRRPWDQPATPVWVLTSGGDWHRSRVRWPDPSTPVLARPGGGFVALGLKQVWDEWSYHFEPTEMWSTADGLTWLQQPLQPEMWVALSDPPLLLWLSDRLVVVASDATTGSPVVWLGRPTLDRDLPVPVATAAMPSPAPPPDEPPLTCPPLPTNVEELGSVGFLGPACFGRQAITVEGWIEPGGSISEYPRGVFIPVALNPCEGGFLGDPDIWLYSECAPYNLTSEVSGGFFVKLWTRPAHGPEVRDGGWYRVTGHFDDRASVRCVPDFPADVVQHEPTEVYINRCRQHFVATDFESVGGNHATADPVLHETGVRPWAWSDVSRLWSDVPPVYGPRGHSL